MNTEPANNIALNTSKVLVHLHVPKCAGVSLTTVLKRTFKDRLVSYHRPNIEVTFKSLTNAERDANFDCLVGHVMYGIHRQYFDRDAVYISMLRDPIERICSFFNFVHTTPLHPLHALFTEHLTDLNQFDDATLGLHPAINANWCNFFCAAYTGRPVNTHDEFIVARDEITARIESGEMVIGDKAHIVSYLRSHGILGPNGDLPVRNAAKPADEVPHDFVRASVGMLTRRAYGFLSGMNALDIRLYEHIIGMQRTRDQS